MTARHLVSRFFASLWPGGPTRADEAWATHYLTVAETALWQRMPGFDRRHAVGVARRVAAALGPDATRPVMAAALLHDVGKIESGFGVWRRVGATLWVAVRGRDRARGRIKTYIDHPVIGADLLRANGADPVTVAWVLEHHLPPERWSLDPELARALKAADDD